MPSSKKEKKKSFLWYVPYIYYIGSVSCFFPWIPSESAGSSYRGWWLDRRPVCLHPEFPQGTPAGWLQWLPGHNILCLLIGRKHLFSTRVHTTQEHFCLDWLLSYLFPPEVGGAGLEECREAWRSWSPKTAGESGARGCWRGSKLWASYVCACTCIQHMCGYLSAIDTCIVSVLVLRVRSPGGGVQCSVVTKLVKSLLTLLNSSYRMSLSEHICVHQALGYLTCRWRFACRHPGSRKLTPSLLTLSSLSTPKSRAGTLGHSADLKWWQ